MRRYVASESVLMIKDDDKCLQSPLYEMASKTKMFLLHFSSSFFKTFPFAVSSVRGGLQTTSSFDNGPGHC